MIAPRVRDVYVLDMISSAQESYFFAKASENLNWDKPCSSYEKGKHHRASFKTKQTSSIKKYLHLLHMDLFGHVTPRSINHENYTLVIVDEYSRNSILVNFCDEKGISQNFSSPYIPEQNGVAERKNRTLIEAARTMLSGSVFSKQYWTEAVATACYTQNRSTIVKIHLKTPYEIFLDNINIAENGRYPPDEYLHPYEPSQRYQTNNNDVSFIEPYECLEPVVLETEVSSDQNGQTDQNDHNDQNDQSVQNDEILNQISEHSSSPRVHDTLVHNIISIPNSSLSIPSMVTPAPQDKWSQDKHIELVIIIGIQDKRNETGIVIKNKARLVAQGYNPQEGIDYDETFSPVSRLEAVMIFLAFATYMNFIVYQMDVKSAFLNGKLKEEVYVKQPPGFESNEFPNHVCKLDKALYGLKQAPRAWYETLSTFLTEHKFVRGKIDNTLFVYKTQTDVILVQIYVDDIIFGSTSTKLCKQFAKLMTQRYEMSMMGVLTYFLRFQIKQSERGILINQEKYVKDLLKKYDINGSSVKTPMVTRNKLGPNLNGKAVNETQYRGMIGSLMYLKGTPSLGLWYPKCSGLDLKGYSDSDYAGCNIDRKSTSGCCANILWMKSQLTNYDIIYEKVPIFCDNTSAIAISNNPILHSRTKHIDIRYHFIRDHILKGDIELHFIPTQYQLADIFTKPLDEPTFKRLIVKLGMQNIDSKPEASVPTEEN
ncbi:retrovirus-related pol polyprotein from transposon TNT 1-94 [Tanacetum coccineum]